MNSRMRITVAVSILLLVCYCAACSRAQARASDSWNKKAAASYLDKRATQWMSWPKAARDQGTFCISCHTAMPYALSRAALDSSLGNTELSTEEHKLIDNVKKRVELWKEIQPYYPSQASQSRGTEAVLNALILANYDARSGHLSTDTLAAFDEMWKLQIKSGEASGAWEWILFDNEPWEAYDSQFYGATLAAIATGLAPEKYRANQGIQKNLNQLREYLRQNAPKQTLLNRVSLLWASAKLPGILTPEQRKSLINDILSKQQSDGGWSASSLVGNWKRRDGTPLETTSDGYATGFIAYVFEQAGVSRDDVHLKSALSWLVAHQGWWSGNWESESLNTQHRNPLSNGYFFMDDAATAYAVLALTGSKESSTKLTAK